jgi:hypothetical protein
MLGFLGSLPSRDRYDADYHGEWEVQGEPPSKFVRIHIRQPTPHEDTNMWTHDYYRNRAENNEGD